MTTSPLNNFLTLSRANPDGLAPFSVPLASGGRIEVWDSGVLCVEPASAVKKDEAKNDTANKDIVISCGIHGNETAPIEMCERLLAEIVSGRLVSAQRLLLIFGNLEAMNLAVREVEDNLNRLFCGQHGQKIEVDGADINRAVVNKSVANKAVINKPAANKERERAAKLEHYMARFYHARSGAKRLHYDLHTAIRPSKYEQFAVYPYMASHTYSRDLLAFLAAADINTLLLSNAPAPTFSCFSAQQFGAQSLTIELGKVMPFGQNEVGRLDRLQQCLSAELSEPSWQPPLLALTDLRVFQVCQEITKHSTQFCFHFSDDVANFSPFSPDTLLATDGDRQWRVAEQDEAVVFPNAQVALGHRAALMAVATELTDKMLC
ncbi:succinylglutamate desuccinylase [Oceanisphaera sp. IT1-181]|uniref:succinylglutamate desuccinylase n=1 Tax=Oceanisphaera sp. IT1-181 TaxID=3081199 RepID=UPI0029CA154A|nr:succinylglutamate desuccinylase [Oceanisphaera sp. IT1-181]